MILLKKILLAVFVPIRLLRDDVVDLTAGEHSTAVYSFYLIIFGEGWDGVVGGWGRVFVELEPIAICSC